MSSKSRYDAISQEEWEKYREEIASLFQDLTYAQIIDHLSTTHDFCPSIHQFGTQVQKRWKLQKYIKAQPQVDAHQMVQERGGKPTEVFIGNRQMPLNKLRKAATAAARAKKRKAEGNSGDQAVQEQSARRKGRQQTTNRRDDITKKIETQYSAPSDNIIVRTPPALEQPPASPAPSSSILTQVYLSQAPIAKFNTWFTTNFQCLAEMLFPPSLNISHQQRFITSELFRSSELYRDTPKNFASFYETETNKNIPSFSDQALSHLQLTKIHLAHEGLTEDVNASPSLSKLTAPFQLLHYMVYLVSNNLLPVSTMCELVEWISTQRLLWIIEILIDSQLPSINIFASMLFNCAVHMGDIDIVTAMLAKGVDPNSRPSAEFCRGTSRFSSRVPPLQAAIQTGNTAMVRVLLGFGAKLTNSNVTSSISGRYPTQTDLDIASEAPRLCYNMIQLLLEHGAKVNVPVPRYPGFTSVLNRALRRKEIEVAKMLLSAGALANDHQCGQSVTALQTAAKYCDGEMVKILIDAGADVNIPIGPEYNIAREVANRTGNCQFFITPLQHATKRNDITMIKVLLDNHAAVDGFDFHEFFSYEYNVNELNKFKGFSDTTSPSDSDIYLDSMGSHYDENKDDDDNYYDYYQYYDILPFVIRELFCSPLQVAAASKNLAMVHLLLEHHPTIDKMGGLGTALQVACMQTGNIEIVKLLIEKGADINSAAHRRYGQTALQAAISAGDTQVAEYLLNNKADVRAPASTLFGQTALQAATRRGYFQLVGKLIERGAEVNEARSMHGQSCLHFAARLGNMDLVCLLLKHGADVNAPASAWLLYDTVLYEAVRSGRHEIVEKILGHGADPSRNDEIDVNYGLVAAATQFCGLKTIDLLLRRGASPNKSNKGGSTPLRLAMNRGFPDLVQMLLSRGGDPNIKDHDGFSAFNWAISEQNEDLIRILIDGGVDVNPPDHDCSESPLAVAIATGNFNIIRMLLAAKANVHGPAGIKGLTKAIDAGRTDVVQFLISLNLRAEHIQLCKEHYELPLTHAIIKKNQEVVDMLLAHDPDFYIRDGRALREAVRHDDLPLMQRLLSYGRPLSPAWSFAAALEIAASRGQVSVAEALITAGADIHDSYVCASADILFNVAINSGSLAMVRLFIQRGAHINPQPKEGHQFTPLQCAVRKGNAGIVNLLLGHGADVNAAAEEDGSTALEAAAENGRLDFVYKMLHYDKEPQTLEQRIQSAARLAEWNGFPLVAKYLEEWQRNRNGQTMS